MSPRKSYDFSSIRTSIITTSDRVLDGTKPDAAGPECSQRLIHIGFREPHTEVIPEQPDAIHAAIKRAIAHESRLIIVLGGSGFGSKNEAPEVARRHIAVEIPGIAEEIRRHGLEHSPMAPLSREIVGITSRDSSGALIVVSPGSVGGASDTLDVLIPLFGTIFSQLDER